MAGGLMRAAATLLTAALAVAASGAIAQGLRDPTRPPGTSAKAGRSPAAHSGWTLQSVLISAQRRNAIINGEVVPVGGSVAGAELIAISEERVTLRTAQGVRIIHLFPDVTRLGAPTAIGSRRTPPQAHPDPQVQSAGEPGTKNENDQ